ncbi:MAG: thioredoxin family protein [Alphaproteobacteria bacterium]|nr:thioredoxin family protein [Alphaproteobacteria bacterium]
MVAGINNVASCLAVCAAFLAVSPSAAQDAASPWAETEQTAVRLISAATGVGDAANAPLGLHFKLQKGWKIYWRSPGDAGFPPRPDWSASTNLGKVTLRWPAPERFSVLGMETLGYKDEVVLPVDAAILAPGQAANIRLKVDYLTCDDICIPYTANLALDLPAGGASPSEFAHLINRYSSAVPGDGAAHGLRIEGLSTLGGDKDKRLRIAFASASPLSTPDVFVEGPVELFFSKPKISFADERRTASAEIAVDGTQYVDGGLGGAPLTITLVDGPRSAERTFPPETIAASTDGAADAGLSIAAVLGLALLGGLILNLMPCVLPVLSIKLLGVVGHGGGKARDVRLSFIASAAGIICSFLVLAGGLIALKAAGGAIGWGIQFQHAWFLIAMGLIVVLFACNLWGFFEFRLPSGLAAMGASGGNSDGLVGHFLTGAFATLLATPCSAPFLGTAVGFALSRGPAEILWVFAALGVGLALPYLAVAAVPSLATRLPRPGPWMVRLRQVLGFALAATAVWLITVIAGVLGAVPAGGIAFMFILMVCFLGAANQFGAEFKKPAAAAVVVLSIMSLAVPVTAGSWQQAGGDPSQLSKLWKPFDEVAIQTHVADGKLVFVDVTADWCVTCQVNKAFILGRDGVMARLKAPNVVAMQADWTRPSDDIAHYLASFGRYGIPFDVVYGPGAPNGVVLPELLSEDAVMDAFARAATKP